MAYLGKVYGCLKLGIYVWLCLKKTFKKIEWLKVRIKGYKFLVLFQVSLNGLFVHLQDVKCKQLPLIFSV